MEMDGVYTGTDRIEQVLYLQELAINISHGSDDPSQPTRDRVDYYCAHFPEELPNWFGEDDRELLVSLVTVPAGDDSEYTGPRCPHGQADYNECSVCSAQEVGGHTFRTCRHGNLPGDCPPCHMVTTDRGQQR